MKIDFLSNHRYQTLYGLKSIWKVRSKLFWSFPINNEYGITLRLYTKPAYLHTYTHFHVHIFTYTYFVRWTCEPFGKWVFYICSYMIHHQAYISNDDESANRQTISVYTSRGYLNSVQINLWSTRCRFWANRCEKVGRYTCEFFFTYRYICAHAATPWWHLSNWKSSPVMATYYIDHI